MEANRFIERFIQGEIMESKKPQKVTAQSPIQLLRDPAIEPTTEVLSKALGESSDAYVKFLSKLTGHDVELMWRYYTDGKAWLGKGLHKWTGARGGRKEMTVFWLSIWEGFFKVTVFVPEKHRAELQKLPLPSDVTQMIADAEQMGERLRFFPVVFDMHSDEMIGALFEILNFKKRLK